MKLKQFIIVIAINLFISTLLFFVFANYILNRISREQITYPDHVSTASFVRSDQKFQDIPLDLKPAARTALAGVVQIKAKFPSQKKDSSKTESADDFLNQIIGSGIAANTTGEIRNSGSGVIISEDGYIITNSHVIVDSKGKFSPEVNVILNNKKIYKAKIIGQNAGSDIAVLKIAATHLPYLVFCNTRSIEPGELVIAAGYPFTLDATVTAGIISSVGKRMHIRRDRRGGAIETYIQTDAAANYGSSGGALVNVNGELIGITSVILSPTKTYMGYSFAIPIHLAKKAAAEIIKNAE